MCINQLIIVLIIFLIYIIYLQMQNQFKEGFIDNFVNHLVLPPILAGRIRPFYRNRRKKYIELQDKYSNIAIKYLKQKKLM